MTETTDIRRAGPSEEAPSEEAHLDALVGCRVTALMLDMAYRASGTDGPAFAALLRDIAKDYETATMLEDATD